MAKKNKKQDPVTLVSNPFNITTDEIREAQNNDELLLDDELEPLAEFETEDDSIFEEKAKRLAKAVEAENETQLKALEETVAEEAEEAAKLLASQIAEDVALQEELAKEDASLDAPAVSAELDQAELESCIEALLFMTDKPISEKKLKELLNPEIDADLFKAALAGLQERYQIVAHGIELVEVANGFQFRTKPGRADIVKKLAKIQTQRLSTGAMETLAIVAYKQPALKDDIDSIRGVDSSHFIRTLLDRKLIEISGRSEMPGRPMVYNTTDHFLEMFALKNIADLPPLKEIEQLVPGSQNRSMDEEDPRIIQMRKMMGQLKSEKSGAITYDPHEDETILQDIRERVNSIPTSTRYLDEQKEIDKLVAGGMTHEQAQAEVTLKNTLAAAPLVSATEVVPEHGA